MNCSNVKINEYKNVKTLIARCVYLLSKMSTNSTKCSMCSFIEQNEQEIAQCVHSLSKISKKLLNVLIH